MYSLFSTSKIKWALLGVALVVFASMSGCSSKKRRVPADLPQANNLISLEKIWSTDVGNSNDFSFKPVLVGDKVFTSSQNGKISAVDYLTGKLIWSATSAKGASTGPGTDGRLLAIGSLKGDIFAYDAQTGKALWDTTVGTQVLTEPLVAAGLVVIRTIDNRFIALDASSGKRVWVTTKNPSILSLRTPYSMLPINNEVLFTGFSNGQFGLLALPSGATIWESLLAPPKGTSEIERLSDIVARPSLYSSRMCLVSYQGKIGCGDIKNAKVSWVKDFSSYSGTTQSQDAVFAVNDRSFVAGFDAQTGDELWRNEKLLWRDVGEPLAVGKIVLAGDGQGYLHVFSQVNGDLISRERVDSSKISAAPIAVAGTIIVQTRGGTLAAYKIK
jgi:outer membrane protein assembly factor BamB